MSTLFDKGVSSIKGSRVLIVSEDPDGVAAALVICYLMRKRSMTYSEAEGISKERRISINIPL